MRSKRSLGSTMAVFVAQFEYRSSTVPRPLLPVAESEASSATVGPVNCSAINGERAAFYLLLVSHERYVSVSSDYAEEKSEPLVATD